MKLKNPPIKEKTVRVYATMKESDDQLLDQYVDYVSEQAGQVNKTDLAASIIKSFMEEDKQFKNWLKSHENQKSSHEPKKSSPEMKESNSGSELEENQDNETRGELGSSEDVQSAI